MWRGAAYADNWGNRFTSRTRLGVQLTAGNIGGHGDNLSLGGLISENNRMYNYNLGYSLPWGGDGARVSVRHSKVDYTLGENYADLGATGHAIVTSGDISIRSSAAGFSAYTAPSPMRTSACATTKPRPTATRRKRAIW